MDRSMSKVGRSNVLQRHAHTSKHFENTQPPIYIGFLLCYFEMNTSRLTHFNKIAFLKSIHLEKIGKKTARRIHVILIYST